MSFRRFPQEPNNGDPPSVPVLRARDSGQPGGDAGGGGDTPDPVRTAEARTPDKWANLSKRNISSHGTRTWSKPLKNVSVKTHGTCL